MAVQIRLARHGSKKSPFYRIVVTDKRNPRDGRFIETLGTFNPDADKFECDRERFAFWQGRGANPSATVKQLLKRYPGDQAAVAGQ